MYMCVSMWRHVIWYDCTCTKDTKVKKCFTDQNTLNTVNTKSSHCFVFPPALFYCLSHKTMKQGGTREWHAARVWLCWAKQAKRWTSSLFFFFSRHPAADVDSRTKPNRAHCQRMSHPAPLSSGCHRGLLVRWCVYIWVPPPPLPSPTAFSLGSYLPYAGGLSQPFPPPASDSETHSCVHDVCVQAHQAGADSVLRSWFIMHLNPYLSSLWLLKG